MKKAAKWNPNWFCKILALYGILSFTTTFPKYGLWEYNRCKTQCCKSNGRMLQKIPRINKKSPEFRIDFMAAYRYNLGT